MNNDTITETIERLLKADADYAEFVRTTRSHQLAVEGVREAVHARVIAGILTDLETHEKTS
jgi:hypothetical protein